MYAVDVPAPRRVAPLLSPQAQARQAAVVAPVPMGQPNAIAAGRGVPTVAPAPPPPSAPSQSMAPIAYAMEKYQQADPFTSAAEGMIYAGQAREQQAADDAKAQQASEMLKDHPDLQKAVATKVMDLGPALQMAQRRDDLAAQKADTEAQAKAAGDRKSQIVDYLTQAGDTDIADQFTHGILDENGVAKAVAAKDGTGVAADSPAALQEYQFYVKQTKDAGGEPLSYMDFKQQTAAGGTAGTTDDAAAIADAIVSGKQPPVTTGLYKLGGPVRAALAKAKYDLSKANQDWVATNRMLSSMNGPQQLRLRQAVTFTKDSLPIIEGLADEWKAGGFPLLNAAQLEAAKQGVLGQKAQSIATRLSTQINDMTSELGTVYKGGNSSTDESLKLAASNLDANWSVETLHDAIKMIRQNLTYRENSMNLVQTGGIADSQYNPMTEGGPPQADLSKPTSDEEYNALPSGTHYIDPDDGQEYVKP